MKLFGGSKGSRVGSRAAVRAAAVAVNADAVSTVPAEEGPAKRKFLKPLAIILALVLLFEGCYFTCVYSQNPFITKLRNAYITTAMETLSHQWLATAIIPADIINEVVARRAEAMAGQVGDESHWVKEESEEATAPGVQEFVTDVTVVDEERVDEEAQKAVFYSMFHEIDQASMEDYLLRNPEALDKGWGNLVIDTAEKDSKGTDILTIHGDRVITIDVPNKVLLIRQEGSGYQGTLAIAKDASKLSLQESAQLGTAGQTVAQIATRTKGVLAMTGSGFIDPNGGGNGGTLSGFAACDGLYFGQHATKPGDKRLELHKDNLMYIYDTSSPVSEDCTDAVEWQPAVIIDGEDVLGYGWDGIQPRAIIGQTSKYEVMMLVIEGRAPMKGVLGITLYDCADILLKYNCMQALNLDGGTSAIMWYNGKTITNCSNTRLEDGRPLPTAFVYGGVMEVE